MEDWMKKTSTLMKQTIITTGMADTGMDTLTNAFGNALFGGWETALAAQV